MAKDLCASFGRSISLALQGIMPRSRFSDFSALLLFLAVSMAVSIAGAAVTATSVGAWYQDLNKPPFNPPDWVFAPVWTALFILMAFAGWRVWRAAGFTRAKMALQLYAVQLILNFGWSALFFGAQQIALAFIELLVLLMAILTTAAAFYKIDEIAAFLFVPYALWVGFAGMLNGAIFLLN